MSLPMTDNTVADWYLATNGSSDYFNVCGTFPSSVPENFAGNQLPRTGDAYCGIHSGSVADYNEYLQA